MWKRIKKELLTLIVVIVFFGTTITVGNILADKLLGKLIDNYVLAFLIGWAAAIFLFVVVITVWNRRRRKEPKQPTHPA
jgi:predicted MFS family arabinose efflux permease